MGTDLTIQTEAPTLSLFLKQQFAPLFYKLLHEGSRKKQNMVELKTTASL